MQILATYGDLSANILIDRIKKSGWGDTVVIRLPNTPAHEPQIVRLIISAEDLYGEVKENG